MKLRVLVCLAILAITVSAQEFRATISGLVTDPAGAPVVNAKILVRSVERDVAYETATNEAGRYVTRFLPAGQYTLTAERDGFKKVTREGLTMQAADRLSLDIQLQLGTVSDSITVTGEPPQLATETASRTATLEQKYVDDLPTSGRNFYQLLFSQPGVTKTSRYWGNFELYAFGNINAISINGGRSGENDTLIDGVTSVRGSRSASFAPSLNAISEVTIVTNSYDSQYGRVGGGVTSVTLRTGTNQLHGQLYEFFKNDNLAAAGWSRNSFNVPRPEYKNNTFGFTVDGPIYIPKVFDGRNKMFFLISTEFLRERNPQTQLWTVATQAERGGNFSALRDGAGRPVTIYDPLTTTPNAAGTGYTRTPFAGNVIPGARINPVGSKVMNFYPEPNRVSESVDGQNNYLFLNSSKNYYDQWIGKLDWNLTDKHRVSGRYGETPWFNFARVQWGTNAAEPSTEYPSTRISRNWGFDWTWTVNPSTVFNLRGGLARYEGFSGNTFGKDYDPRQLGFPSELVSQFTSLHFPRFNIQTNNYSPLGSTRTSNYETQDTYSLQPNVQTIRGTHSLKFGGELRRYNNNQIRPNSASGNYTIGRNWTQANPLAADALSGNSLATFLLGYVTSGYIDRNNDPAYSNGYTALFFQDDWKIRRNLTLNLGLRWDYEAPIVERYNQQVRGFAFDQASPLQSRVQGLTLNGGLLFAGNSGTARQAFNRDRNNFQPRVGVAWQVKPKWVVRGGYGLYYLGQNAAGPDTGFSRPTSMITSTDNGLTPAANLSDPFPRTLFPNGLLQPIGASQGLSTNLGLGISAQSLDRPLPYSHQFSFGIQHQLPGQWVADASYVGNLTRSLPLNAGMNFIPADQLNSLPQPQRAAYFNAQVANPMRGLLPGSAFNGATLPRQQTLVAFPHFSQVTIQNLPIGQQSYHSLQAKGTRRFRNGLAMQLSYTLSKMLERVSLLNAQDLRLNDLDSTVPDQQLAPFDIPHTFTMVSSYELPFGKGRPYLNNMGGVANMLFGGWNVSAQYIYRSGQPIDFPNAAPLQARSAKLTSSQRDEIARSTGGEKFNPIFNKWFDTTLFPRTAQAAFTLRDFPTRFPDVRSTYLQSWELSGYKEFPVKERLKVQFRADFQNAFDYAYFGRIVSANVTDSRFGQLNPEQDNSPRVIALVLKVLF
ncbi:MAG: TonB-dependent receptor [Bryobacterales bacterium]|nr:TonB-dependent receptor [Bryobacterales bacterium]